MSHLFLSLFLLLSAPASMENPASLPASESLIVVVNTADWCPVCQKNGPRVEKELLSEFMKDDAYTIVINNLSTDDTKAMAQEKLAALGLATFSEEHNGTGKIYFIHPESKEIIEGISVRKSTEKIRAAFEEALATL